MDQMRLLERLYEEFGEAYKNNREIQMIVIHPLDFRKFRDKLEKSETWQYPNQFVFKNGIPFVGRIFGVRVETSMNQRQGTIGVMYKIKIEE